MPHFNVQLDLAGDGSATDLAAWMAEAGWDAVGDDATHSVLLRDLAAPAGDSSYFFWDLRDFNASYGADLALTGITVVPEPTAWVLLALGLGIGAGMRRRLICRRP